MKQEYSVSRIAQNLKISRQAMYKKSRGRRVFYDKKEDQNILPLIQGVTEKRSTYGYKRVTAMVNRNHGCKLNKKRVYRIMKKHGLLLPKTKVERKHSGTGKVMTLHSNTRWCSDAFEIKCFNAEKVYVAFSLDCKDREAMAYVARKRPLLAQDIQELMITSVEHRFGDTRTPRMVEWLTDRGAIYRAKNVQQLGRWLGLKTCYTAPYSPSSNGMAEAFVGTFKRDYVYVSDCYSADQVIGQLQQWFDDYNNVAPHSALDMQAPREYLKNSNR
jgi:putative transposase